MPLIVTGTIGIDTIETPFGKADQVLGGSCTYFAAAASFFAPVRMVAAVGGDFDDHTRSTLARFPNVCVEGLETRSDSKTFAWGGKYLNNWNTRETIFTELGVLAEAPPLTPEEYRDSKYVFLANSHPSVQLDLLKGFPKRTIAVADTMDLWIDTAKTELLALLAEVDGVVLNDQEAAQLTGHQNPLTAGKAILEFGPTFAVIKKGEHGCLLVHQDGMAALPAYPTETVNDPTGAGDSFGGGMMGHIARTHSAEHFGDEPVTFNMIRQGLAFGTIIASFTVEAFSLERLAALTEGELLGRLDEFKALVALD